MHLRVRSSEQFPSGLELFTVQADGTEVHNTAAQELWEGAPFPTQPVYLKVLDDRPIVPALVVQFIEYGYSCIFQERNGVGQWYLELATDGSCPDTLTNGLRRHPLFSDNLFQILGERYSQILALTQIAEGVPASVRGATHRVEVNLRDMKGVLDYATGFTPLVTSPDAQLSDLFLVLCGADSPHTFVLRYRGGLRQYGYGDAVRDGIWVWGCRPLERVVAMMAEPYQ